MSMKRNVGAGRGPTAGSDIGAKIDRQSFYDELKRLAGTGQVFTPVDVSLAIGAGEPLVSRALLGLAVEGLIEKVETGKYRATGIVELEIGEFVKAFARASKTDSTRQRDLSEIDRLKKNNDIMRSRLVQAQAERDHYLALLRQHGIEPGPAPVPSAGAVVVSPEATAATES